MNERNTQPESGDWKLFGASAIRSKPDIRGKSSRLVATARRLLRQRRMRTDGFPVSLFGEPAWDMLLEIYIREYSGLRTTNMQLHHGKSPRGRWIRHLEGERLVYLRSHPVNHGTQFVELTARARSALERYLQEIDTDHPEDALKRQPAD